MRSVYAELRKSGPASRLAKAERDTGLKLPDDIAYVDVRKAAALSGDVLPAAYRSVRSFGLTASTAGSTCTVHMRLVVS